MSIWRDCLDLANTNLELMEAALADIAERARESTSPAVWRRMIVSYRRLIADQRELRDKIAARVREEKEVTV